LAVIATLPAPAPALRASKVAVKVPASLPEVPQVLLTAGMRESAVRPDRDRAPAPSKAK